jgi:predicted enzyme related to lactoylglutathione lyase
VRIGERFNIARAAFTDGAGQRRHLSFAFIAMDGTVIKGIKFVGIPVSDQDRALEFYTKRLGFSITTDQPFNDKQRWIELKIPGADSGVVLFTPEGQEDRIGQFQSISFWTSNVQKTYEDLSSRGVEFRGPPTTADWGSSALFKDPDGNQFVLGSK